LRADLAILGFALALLAGCARARIALARRGDKPPPVVHVPVWLGWLIMLGIAGFMTFMLWGLVQVAEAGYFDVYRWLVVALSLAFVVVLVRKFLPKGHFSDLLASTASVLTMAPWVLYPNWLSIDVAALVMATSALIVPKASGFRSLVYVEIGIVLYDIYSVFASGLMMGMARFALPHGVPDVPILMVVPSQFDLAATYTRALGLGDVVLPGLMIMAAASFVGHGIGRRLHYGGIVGYALGLLVTFAVLEGLHAAQPATLYLVPGTMLGIGLVAWREGVWRELWGTTVRMSILDALKNLRRERTAQS
jgi:presenilin-like A22 family membrane protease